MGDARPDDPITVQQGYDAMFLFLLEFWNRGAPPSDDPVEWLLVAMDRTTGDGGSNDPAMDADWRACVGRVRDGLDPYVTAWDRRGGPPASA
jgi:hypothetical protein